jgi:hypothetical protein
MPRDDTEKGPESAGFIEFSIPNASGEELREVVERRLGVFDDPDLLERLSATTGQTAEELGAHLKATITPIREDTYAELANLVHGNIRAALHIIAYFQGIFPTFRATDPESRQTAAFVKQMGFSPGSPWEITPIDIAKVASRMDEGGFVELFRDQYSSLLIHLSDNPEEIEVFMRDEPAIDMKPETLPVPYIDTSSRMLEG